MKTYNQFYKKYFKENRLKWGNYFINIYGENPKCEICSKKLSWKNKRDVDVLMFDHQGTKQFQCSIGNWIQSHNLSEGNRTIWRKCNFGILCFTCNKYIPRFNRIQFLKTALEYAYKHRD